MASISCTAEERKRLLNFPWVLANSELACLLAWSAMIRPSSPLAAISLALTYRGFSRYALACRRPNSPSPITQARTGRGPTRLAAFFLPERMVVGPRGWEPRPLEVLNGSVEVGLPVPQCPHEVPGEELLNEEVLQSPNVVAVVI